MAKYRIKRPGDILELKEMLDNADIGLYILLRISEDTAHLCRLGVDLETDDLVVTDVKVQVSLADLSLFQCTGFVIEDAAEHITPVAVGLIMEPIEPGDPVPIGLYQVVQIERDDILLSRLHSNEDGKLATTQRLSWIARSQLGSFRRLHVEDHLRP